MRRLTILKPMAHNGETRLMIVSDAAENTFNLTHERHCVTRN
jgi:hypothetical protein